MKKIIILLIFCINTASCDLDGWNTINKTGFVEACVEEAGEEFRGFCECGLKEVMKEYTPSEADNLPDEYYAEIAEACIDTLMDMMEE